MSITFLSITCTDCDFRGSSFATTGLFRWSHKGQTFDFERRLGLCLDCNKIVATEDFPDAETMERAQLEMKHTQDRGGQTCPYLS